MQSIRPAVSVHSLTVLSRSVHPELFQIHRTQQVSRKAYRARLDITSEGHVISFSSGQTTICEVVASANQDLPARRRLTAQPVGESNRFQTVGKDIIRYQTETSIENASRELFWQIQQQFVQNNAEHELLHVFGTSGRVALGAVSYIHVDERAKQLTVQAFHTFPDEYAILKSFSVFSVTR